MQKDSEEPTPVPTPFVTQRMRCYTGTPSGCPSQKHEQKANTKYLVRFPRRETKSVLSLWMRHRGHL
jgi:hypothetical protein